MASWITFAWQIEFITIAIFIYALIVFLRAAIHLDKEFRMAILFVLASLIINTALGIMIGIFITKKVGYDTLIDFWVARPIISLVGAFLVLLGARKFFSALEKTS